MSYGDLIQIPNPWNKRGPVTTTEVDIYDDEYGTRIVLVHERADNMGVSITNAAETVYAAVVDAFQADAVIEVYDDSSYEWGRDGKASYSQVTLDSTGHAEWKYLGSTREEAIDTLLAHVAS